MTSASPSLTTTAPSAVVSNAYLVMPSTEPARQIVRRCGIVGRAVEQAHYSFDEDDIVIFGENVEIGFDSGQTHRPGIEIEAESSGCRLVIARIDVIGANLGRGHLHASIAQGAEDSEGYDRLTASRLRRGNYQALSQWHSPGEHPCTSRARSATR